VICYRFSSVWCIFVQVIVVTAISYGFDLQDKYDIIIVDDIPTG